MPQPFRAIAPPPIATEKLLLLQSQNLALAFSVDQVQEVLLKASVTKVPAYENSVTEKSASEKPERSVTNYRGDLIPVVFGTKACPPMPEVTLGLIKAPDIKGGFVAIACLNLPNLVAISPQDWQNLEIDTSPWQSDGRVYNFNSTNYSHIIGIVKRS